MIRYLVTGGNGFIGSHLVPALDGEVIVTSRKDGSTLDRNYCRSIIKDVDVVVHLGWSTLPGTSEESRVTDISENLAGTVTLLEACVEARIKKFVFMSTGGTVYGVPQFIPVSEEHPVAPICSYGVTKATVEKYLQLFERNHGLPYAILRGANFYGPGQTGHKGQGVIAAWLQQLHEGAPVSLHGDGSAIRDFLFIDDAVRGIISAIQSEDPRLLLNLGSGVGCSLSDLLAIIKEVTEIHVDVHHNPGRHFDVPASVLDISQAKEKLGWEPKVPLEEGIRLTWESWHQSKKD